jgi:hypothetical protein
MRGGWRAAAILAVMVLCAGACDLPGVSKTASGSPEASPSPSPNPSPTAPPTPATISGFPLAAGEVALAYSAALSASGGTAPFTWSVIAGGLPGGVNLGQDGSLTGTPTSPGTFTFSVQVTDKNNASSNASGSIKVYPRLVASLIPACASACSVEQGCVNVCGSFGTQSGGAGPYKYAGSGNIPKGETLNGLSLAGSFPSLAQFWQFNVTVTDALGATSSISPIFYVYKHIAITKTTWLCGNSPSSCTLSIPYVGGTPNGRPTMKVIAVTGFGGKGGASVSVRGVTGGCTSTPTTKPPPQETASASGGILTYSLQNPFNGTCYGYSGRIAIVLVDQSPCGSPANCTSNAAIIDIGV